MADTEKDVNRAAAAPQEEASAAQAAPEAPQPETCLLYTSPSPRD